MITIEKDGRKLKIPYSAYVQDYKDIGWVIIKKAEPKVSVIKEEKKEIVDENKETKIDLKQPIKQEKNGGRK